MDPNAAWNEILLLLCLPDLYDQDIDDLDAGADRCDSLIEWIDGGGFLPKALETYDRTVASNIVLCVGFKLRDVVYDRENNPQD